MLETEPVSLQEAALDISAVTNCFHILELNLVGHIFLEIYPFILGSFFFEFEVIQVGKLFCNREIILKFPWKDKGPSKLGQPLEKKRTIL